jgi:hypothetical protein
MARKYGPSTRKGQTRKTARKAYFPVAKRRRGTSPRVKTLESALQRARARSRKLSVQHTNPKAAQALGMGVYGGAVVTAGGGAAAGVVGELFPAIAGIDTRLLAGAALVAWGAMSKTGGAQIGACIGSGMLACYTEDLASAAVSGETLALPFINEEVG